MTKKRKTLKQKKIADIRKIDHTPNDSSQIAYSFTTPTATKSSPRTTPSAQIVDHSYVATEVRNTLLISLILVTVNLVVFALLRNNIINFSFLGL